MTPDIDFDMLRERGLCLAIASTIAGAHKSKAYLDPERMTNCVAEISNRAKYMDPIETLSTICSILVMELTHQGVIGCNPQIDYGHQLLDEMMAVQVKHRAGLGKLRDGMTQVFLDAAKEDKGDDWDEAVVHSLECLIMAGLIENARQLELRLN
jgi:hypothetical protein